MRTRSTIDHVPLRSGFNSYLDVASSSMKAMMNRNRDLSMSSEALIQGCPDGLVGLDWRVDRARNRLPKLHWRRSIPPEIARGKPNDGEAVGTDKMVSGGKDRGRRAVRPRLHRQGHLRHGLKAETREFDVDPGQLRAAVSRRSTFCVSGPMAEDRRRRRLL